MSDEMYILPQITHYPSLVTAFSADEYRSIMRRSIDLKDK